jgi:dihydroorotate dehydrogenase
VQNIIFRIIRKFPPEISHDITLKLLKLNFNKKKIFHDPILYQHIFGFDFSNPIGMAAGFDKNVEIVNPLLKLGFGFVEVGTVTPKPQYGNDKPRIFRLNDDFAIINHLGFNNKGSDFAKKQLKKLNLNTLSKGIVGINISINKDSSNYIDDYNYCLEKLGPHAHYVTINISSPNTPGLRDIQNRGQIEKLVQSLQNKKNTFPLLENTPIFFKISPDLDEEQIRDIALISLANNIDGLIISNSTIDRPTLLKSNLKNEIGGLSGKPLFLKSTIILKQMYTLTNGQIPLIGVGGISNALECYEKIKAGASLVQLYTALVYEGPEIINNILSELINLLKTDGYKNVKEAIGRDV